MGLSQFTHIALLMADNEGGNFEIELGSISAFRYGDDEMNYPHVKHALELNNKKGYDDCRG